MDDSLRLLERKIKEGGDDLDHVRYFNALWKRGEADLYIFVKDMIYEEPLLRLELTTETKPAGLRVPVTISMRLHDYRPDFIGPRLTFHVNSGKAPQKAAPVRWDGIWRPESNKLSGEEIKTHTYETTWAMLRNKSPRQGKIWTFYPMVTPRA